MAARRIASLLADLAVRHPGATAVLMPNGYAISFGELQGRADRVRAVVRPGTRVGVRLANDAESLAAIHGVWQAGSSVVAISHLVPDAEARRRLEEVGAGLLANGTAGGSTEAAPTDEAVVMFTSGTTGRPKAAAISFSGFAASLRGIATGSKLPPDGRPPTEPMRHPRAIFVPLAHMGGLLGSLTGWFLGAPLLLCPKWSTDLAFDMLNRFSITSLGLTPAMVFDLVMAPNGRGLGAVRSVGVGTAPLPEATRVAFEARYNVPILRNYGQTEFAGAIAFERYGDVMSGCRSPGSVGRLAPGVEVLIRDELGNHLPKGQIGEIVARSASAMRGYLSPPEEQGQVRDHDGWIATGDLGYLDDGDMLTVVGRTRDMIICGGFNVYPSIVEAALNQVPGVADAAVAGLPDDRLGHVPVAVVVSEARVAIALADIREKLSDQLAPYELPRKLRLVAEVPRTENGKVDRVAVADLFET